MLRSLKSKEVISVVKKGIKFNKALEENPGHDEVACTETDNKKILQVENEDFFNNIPRAKQKLHKKVKTCPECLEDIGNKNLTNHRKENLSYQSYVRRKNRTGTCPECQKKVGNGNLSRHMMESHNKETFACSRCDKVFTHKGH